MLYFPKVVQFVNKAHGFITHPSQKSWNPHTKIKLCLTKSQTFRQGAEVVPTLDTRHTLSANNKSPPDIKVPLPHSPQNKSSVGSKPDWTDVSASTSWGGVRLVQLWSTKRRNSQCQEPSAENAPRAYSQRERHQRQENAVRSILTGRVAEMIHDPREAASHSAASFLTKLCKFA